MRKKRTPFGQPKLALSIDAETSRKLESQNKVARWFNDTDDRIQRALDGGWEFLNAKVKVGTEEEEQDNRIKKRVGRDLYAFLMAIPKKFYDEDQAAKEERNQMVDDAIRGGTPPGLNHHGIDGSRGSTSVKSVDYKP
jgi:hypothetical protein